MCDDGYHFDKPIACRISDPSKPEDVLGRDTDSFLNVGIVDSGFNNNFYLQFSENYEDYQHLFTAFFTPEQALELKNEIEDYLKRLEDDNE